MTADPHIEPTDQQISALLADAETNDQPVVMINLLKFKDAEGRESYLRYAREVQPHLERVGASLVYAGDAAAVVIGDDDAAWWDTVLVVLYPSRKAFLEMVLEPAYLEVAVHRTRALADSRLIATDPWSADGVRDEHVKLSVPAATME